MARQQTPISGRSTPPTARARAISGEAVRTASGSSGARSLEGRSSRQAASRQAKKVRANQIRASPATLAKAVESPSSWRGSPNRAIAGRYGL